MDTRYTRSGSSQLAGGERRPLAIWTFPLYYLP
jgi:hypothetical protein